MNSPDRESREILSVSQLNRRARQLLETHLPLIWVEGEISGFARPSSGHWYFTIKDEQAQARCAMFRNRNQRAALKPENGNQVLLRCRVSLYEDRGDYQLIVEYMEAAGHGLLQQRFEALKARLQAEGLFAPEHKQPLPAFPRRIGIITSPTGAALQDILTVLQRRFPAIPVTVYPTQVQGEAAAAQICACLERANREQRCDALIVGRGGGSREDLWPFNEEQVARAIFASALPVVSAVGHEVDFTIADFAADCRAATPSAAAELLSPDSGELAAALQGFEYLLQQCIAQVFAGKSSQMQALRKRLRHPRDKLREHVQQLDQLEIRLYKVKAAQLERQRAKLQNLGLRLEHLHPRRALQKLHSHLAEREHRLKTTIKQLLQNRRSQWRKASELLNAVSPLQTLDRGYAILLDDRQRAVKRLDQAAVGDRVSARVSDGTMRCQVLEKKVLEKKPGSTT